MYHKTVATNKKAYHNYFIEETIEAGIVLHGFEVKSLRVGKSSIAESYVRIKNDEVYLLNSYIAEYKFSTYDQLPTNRDRKLLVHKREIKKIKSKITKDGYTAVVTKIYFKGNYVKVEIGIAKGKQLHDKRAALKAKTQNREIKRAFKNF